MTSKIKIRIKIMKSCYVYFLANWNNSVLYIGVTNDIRRRLDEHIDGESDSFATKYKTFKLVYNEEYNNPQDAINREKQLKRWSRSKKNALVESINPEWNDLLKI